MQTTWILVADSSRARIFLATTLKAPLTEITSLEHPESRQQEQELTSDLAGRQSAGARNNNHSSNSVPDAKKHEIEIFAKEILRQLEDGRKQHRYEQLIMIAAPEFLGLLREGLSSETRKMVVHQLDKNLAQHSPQQIRDQLPELLPSLAV